MGSQPQRSLDSHRRARCGETRTAGSEGDRAEKDRQSPAPRRTVDPTRTVRLQFLVELEARGGAKSLAELNELFSAWLEGVYHRSVHSETGQAPIERLMAARALRRPSPAELREAFLWSTKRRADKTAAVSLFGNHYEVDPALVGSTIELVYDPFDMTDIEVRYEGRAMGKAIPRKITRHTHPAARQESPPAPKASGIDYLGLVAERVARETARRIAYAEIDPSRNDPSRNDMASSDNPTNDKEDAR
jgi:putative transposase